MKTLLRKSLGVLLMSMPLLLIVGFISYAIEVSFIMAFAIFSYFIIAVLGIVDGLLILVCIVEIGTKMWNGDKLNG